MIIKPDFKLNIWIYEIFDMLHCGFLIVDKKGKIAYTNKAAEIIFKKTKNDLLNQFITDIIPIDDGKFALNRNIQSDENRILINDSAFFINTYVLKEENNIKGSIYTINDVRKETRAEQNHDVSVHNSYELSKIIENSYDGIWIMDSNGKILNINKAYERISGISTKELIGLYVHDLVEKGYISEAASLSVFEKKEPVSIMQLLRNGKSVLVTANPVFDDNGNMWRVISNVRDITEMIRLKQDLEEAKNQTKQYQEEVKKLKTELYIADNFVASSETMKNIFKLGHKLSNIDSNVLILGESGVGKGVVVDYFHNCSKRSNGPIIKVNCGAIPENLLESELFGFEKGAFTGASVTGKKGMFELAQGGTIFLDEIGELPLNLQVKLLRAIQDREIYRIGGVNPIKLEIRIIAATNRNLEEMMRSGHFRKDLYYRLNVIPIHIPPLRNRREDITPLIYFFLNQFNKKYNKDRKLLPQEIHFMINYEWPGNIREMENLLERMVVLEESVLFEDNSYDHDSISKVCEGNQHEDTTSLNKAIEKLEAQLLQSAIKKYGSIRKAAKALDLNHTTAIRKIKKYGIKYGEFIN